MLAKNATTPLGIWFDALSFTTIVGTPPGAGSLPPGVVLLTYFVTNTSLLWERACSRSFLRFAWTQNHLRRNTAQDLPFQLQVKLGIELLHPFGQ